MTPGARAFRSVNGGLVFSQAATHMFTTLDCEGLHGHVKVSPADGTVYVPNGGCGGSVPFHDVGAKQAALVSEDNGITWSIRPIHNSTIDKEGRIVLGYDDGCISAACINGGANDFTAKGVIARQSGGMRMFAAFDPAEPTKPAAPQATGVV